MKIKKGENMPFLLLAGETTDSAGCMGLGVFCYAVRFVRVVGNPEV